MNKYIEIQLKKIEKERTKKITKYTKYSGFSPKVIILQRDRERKSLIKDYLLTYNGKDKFINFFTKLVDDPNWFPTERQYMAFKDIIND